MDFQTARNRLARHLEIEIKDKRVLAVLARIPRELFVPPEIRHFAYEDRPLPIGLGQTISQPYIAALMTQELGLTGDETVLEVGTGSGYQTAILAELVERVVTVERFPQLAKEAQIVLEQLGYTNIEMHVAEESLGWGQEAPYDAIMVTAGAPCVPDELVCQLRIRSCMVIPIGSQYEQELLRITREKGNAIKRERLANVRFVPLVGDGAWEKE